jgi:ABC-type antimicrobial peptide transport system permease subunit
MVLGELAMVAAIAILAGSLVAAQAPLLKLIPGLEPLASALGLLGSAAGIMAMVLICGLYPSVLAMRAEPAESLHYE